MKQKGVAQKYCTIFFFFSFQYTVGDYEEGFYLSDLEKVHPAQQEQLLAPDAAGSGAAGTLKKAAGTVLKGTLRGLGMGTLKKLKSAGSGSLKRALTVSDAELAKIKEKIVAEWRNLRVSVYVFLLFIYLFFIF